MKASFMDPRHYSGISRAKLKIDRKIWNDETPVRLYVASESTYNQRISGTNN